MGNALRKDIAVFHQVPAQSVDALGALTNQEIAGSKHDAVRLLLFGLDRNEAHARPLGRFTDGLCTGGIVLLPLDERLDVGRRDQAHMMAPSDLTPSSAHRYRLPSPQRTGFAARGTEGLRASDALAKRAHARHHPLHEPGTRLRDVQTDRANLLHGRLLRWQFDTVTLAHRCRRGASTPSPRADPPVQVPSVSRRVRRDGESRNSRLLSYVEVTWWF